MCVRFPALKGSCENARCGLRHGGSAIARLPSPPAAAPSARFHPALSLISGNRPRFTAGPRLSERSSRAGTGGERWSPWCAWGASAARMRRDAVVSRRPASASTSPRVPRRRSPPCQLSSPAPPPSIFGPLALNHKCGGVPPTGNKPSPRVPRRCSPPCQLSSPAPPPSIFGPLALNHKCGGVPPTGNKPSPRVPRRCSPPCQLSSPAPPPSIFGPLALIAEECALPSYLLSYSSYPPTRLILLLVLKHHKSTTHPTRN
jgi:hypothetical protein